MAERENSCMCHTSRSRVERWWSLRLSEKAKHNTTTSQVAELSTRWHQQHPHKSSRRTISGSSSPTWRRRRRSNFITQRNSKTNFWAASSTLADGKEPKRCLLSTQAGLLIARWADAGVHPHLLRGARSLAHSLAACMRLVLRGVNGSRGSAGSRRRRTPVTSPPISGRRRLAAANNSRLPVTGAHSLHKRCCCWFLLFTSRSSLPLAHNTRRSPLLPRALHQLIISVRSRAQARV